MLGDAQTSSIISGWDWFQADTKTPLTSVAQLRDAIQLVRCGSIPDNSCFYHTICKSISPIYQEEKKLLAWFEEAKLQRAAAGLGPYPQGRPNLVENARQYYADKFRQDLAIWLCSPQINTNTGEAFTEVDAQIYINTSAAMMEATLNGNGSISLQNPLRPYYPTYSSFSPVDFPTGQRSAGQAAGEAPNQRMPIRLSWPLLALLQLYTGDEAAMGRTLNAICALVVNSTTERLERKVRPAVADLVKTAGAGLYTPEGLVRLKEVAAVDSRYTPETYMATLAEAHRKVTVVVPPGSEVKKVGYTGFPLTVNHAAVKNVLDLFDKYTNHYLGQPLEAPAGPWHQAYHFAIWTGLSSGKSTDDIMVDMGLITKADTGGRTVYYGIDYTSLPYYTTYQPYVKGYIETLRALITAISLISGENVILFQAYRPIPDSDPSIYETVVGDLVPANVGSATPYLQLLQCSINAVTQTWVTYDEAESIISVDPREGIIDGKTPEGKAIMALPLNLNYFMVNRGYNIAYYNNSAVTRVGTTDVVEYYRLTDWLKKVLPPAPTGGVIHRHDAGVTDLVTQMPFAIDMNIYIVELFANHIRVHSAYKTLDPANKPSLVIHWTGGHFEIVGTWEGETVKTTFEPKHAFILAIEEYFNRLSAGGGHAAVFKTLRVSKIPDAAPTAPTPRLLTSVLKPPVDEELEIVKLMSQLGVSQSDAAAIYRAQHAR